MDYLDMLEQQNKLRMTKTENGADAYATSGEQLVDFNFSISAMRSADPNEIITKYIKAYSEDALTAVLDMFYIGDIRQGLGERRIFRSCLEFICASHPDIAKAVLPLIPEYSRWDSVLVYLKYPQTRNVVARFIKHQLLEDMKRADAGESISLCAKWMPSINASSTETVLTAKKLTFFLGWSERKYRKTLSKLRRYANVVEVKMSAGEWWNIDYEAVPSRANLLYEHAFMKNDQTRRIGYLQSLAKGEKKINSGVLYPHEIVQKIWNRGDPALYEPMWKALPDYGVRNTLVIRDGSGSMTWFNYRGSHTRPIDVATALAIYLAEHNSQGWRDKFITFSSDPEVVDMSGCKTLRDKVRLAYSHNEYANTDIYKTMRLILDTAVANKIPADEMPESIVILSDMRFDAHEHHFGGSLFDGIKKQFEAKGYKLPRICFWNLVGDTYKTVPMQENDNGLVLCSGFSPNIINMMMSGDIKDPYDILLHTLNGDRYKAVKEAVKGLL